MEPKGSLTFSQHPATYLLPEPVEATSRPPNLLFWQPWILLSHPRLCVQSSFFNSDFPTKILHAFLFSTTRVGCAIHLFIINLITPIILIRHTKFWSSSLCRLNDMKAWFWIAKWRSLIIIIRSWHVWMKHCEFTWREYAKVWSISIGVAGQHRHFELMSNTYKNPECLLIPSEYIQCILCKLDHYGDKDITQNRCASDNKRILNFDINNGECYGLSLSPFEAIREPGYYHEVR